MIEQIDQLVIGDKASYDDFYASIAERKIKQPKKKTIKETVPFSNKTYDFSAMNGEVYWEERELEYIFELMADSPEELEDMKRAFSSWLMNVQEEEIHDPFIPNYHFVGTYDDMSYADEEDVEKTTATVIFKAYPYMIANVPAVYEVSVPYEQIEEVEILNESNHPITPIITIDNNIVLEIGDARYELSAGTINDETYRLPKGLSKISFININNNKATCNVNIKIFEEVV